ncbi:MAG: ABC transporter substrate-binding protein [Thermomicrobium sp.]|nr:ABC transporter substrate-binding protein [Thermomicrobium sp.]
MNRRRWFGFVAGTLTVSASALLASCGQSATPTPAASAPTPTTPAAATPTTAATATAASPMATATSAPATRTPGSTSTVKARIALTASDAAFLVAVDRGFFQDAGLSVELVTATLDPGQAISLLGAGQLDLVGGGISAALVNGIKQGVALKIVVAETVITENFGNYHVIGAAKTLADAGELRSVADLKGKTIALVTSSGGDVLETKKVLAQHGLTLADVQIQTLRAPDVPTALQNAAVAVGFLIEPYVTIALEQLQAAVPLVDGSTIARAAGIGLPLNVLSFGPRLLGDRSLAVAFLAAYLRGVAWYYERIGDSTRRQEIAEVLKKYTPLKDDQLYARMTWPPIARDGRFEPAFLDEYQALWHELGQIQDTIPVADLVDFSYLDEAAKQVS